MCSSDLALKVIGVWMKVNGEAIYGTTASPLAPLAWGRCTKKNNGGAVTLYLSVFDWPANGKLVVPGVKGEVRKASLLAGGSKLSTSVSADGLVITVPATAPDALASVIKVEMK